MKASNLVDLHCLIENDVHTYLHDMAPSPGDFSKLVRHALRNFVNKDKEKKRLAEKAIADAGKA